MSLRFYRLFCACLLLPVVAALFVPHRVNAVEHTGFLTYGEFQGEKPLVPEPELARRGFSLFVSNDADSRRLWSQTRLVFASGLIAAGILYTMPAELTGWEKDVDSSELADRWWRNVSRSPVWDKDHWTINYVGHAYFGGVYYQVARKSGYGQWDSFVYTTLMSTFFWEYGLEAFAERPSVQDLIYTPLSGWLCGEWAHRAEQRILTRDGQVLGSTALGSVSLFLLDPVDRIGDWLNRLSGRDLVMTGAVVLSPFHGDQGDSHAVVGVAISGRF
ncbi:MAG: DUF3943 domain-containing protein [Pelovirga sp.]